jgi:hypothetical protein
MVKTRRTEEAEPEEVDYDSKASAKPAGDLASCPEFVLFQDL